MGNAAFRAMRQDRKRRKRELDARVKDGIREVKDWLFMDGWKRDLTAWVNPPFRLERNVIEVNGNRIINWDLTRDDEHPGEAHFSDVTLPLMPLIVLMEREAW